jgi:hypothetical protein
VSFPLDTCKGFCFSCEVFLSRARAADLGFHFSFPALIPAARFGLDTGKKIGHQILRGHIFPYARISPFFLAFFSSFFGRMTGIFFIEFPSALVSV